ncbi:MAG: HU family DNA-binding protein [Deltaproteobacteria bacterium]|nr:HU family DNA-binding protein [Deltaproteobacteria bacterium]
MKKSVVRILACVFIFGLYSTEVNAAPRNSLSNAMAEKFGITKEEAEQQVRDVFLILGEELKKGRMITVTNFGRFYVKQRDARKGRNPRTGKEMDIPARKYPRFTSSQGLKALVNEK